LLALLVAMEAGMSTLYNVLTDIKNNVKDFQRDDC